MGFIKAIGAASVGQLSDMYREVIKYKNIDKNILIKKVSTNNGIIQNESRLFVEPGQCVIYTDNGSIKDIISEPGMYFMDTSSPSLFQINIFKGIAETFLQTMKRIAYEGSEITAQSVYFISLTEIPNINFNTTNDILYKDPEWGPMEVSFGGSYGIKVSNPINLLTNINGNSDEYYFSMLSDQINDYICSKLMTTVSSLKISFDLIPSNINQQVNSIMDDINKQLENMGIEITRIVISDVDVPEEIKKSMYERTNIKMKATSVDEKGADIYTKLNTAEAIREMAKNQNSAGTSVLGMNLGNTIGGIVNKNVDRKMENSIENKENITAVEDKETSDI